MPKTWKLPDYRGITMSILSSTSGKALLLGLLLTTGSACSTGKIPATAEPPKLTLQGANGANHCTLDFKTYQYRFENSSHCKNDQAVGIELEHAPSASNILLTDDDAVDGKPGCTTDNPGNYFWIMLRTVKENVSVPPIDLDDIVSTPVGGVVAPGVKVVDHYQRRPGDSPKKRTSCVKIDVDAPEPSVPMPRP